MFMERKIISSLILQPTQQWPPCQSTEAYNSVSQYVSVDSFFQQNLIFIEEEETYIHSKMLLITLKIIIW